MINKFLKLSLFVVALFIFGCTSSDDEPEIQGLDQINETEIGQAQLFDNLRELYNADNGALHKPQGGKDIKPYWAAEYSYFFTEQGWIVGAFRIPNSDLVYVYDYPINGEDRIHVQGDWGHMTWNDKEPKVFIYDLNTGLTVYSNWCEENRTGFFQENLSGLIDEYDFSGDGETDVWRIGVGPNHNPDSHGEVHIKTTLTDGQISQPWVWPVQGECKEATTEVNFDVIGWVKNGHISLKIVLDGKKYEGELN